MSGNIPSYSSMFKPLSVICLAAILSLSSSLSLLAMSSPSQGLPGRRVGGGSRGCQELQSLTAIDPKQLIALMPQENVAKTAADYPTLFVRIPKLPSVKNLEFVLRDDRDKKVYKTTFQSPDTGGVLSLPLPASAMSPLAANKPYHWYFSIICDASDRSKDISVEGNIQRVNVTPVLASKLRQSSPSQQVDLLIANGLWQDALATLITLRRSHPQDSAIASKWTQLLKSAGLDTRVAQDIILSQSPAAQSPTVKP